MEFEGPLQGQQYALGGELPQLRIQNEMEDNHGQRACLSVRWWGQILTTKKEFDTVMGTGEALKRRIEMAEKTL
jgi:hypothetical protein